MRENINFVYSTSSKGKSYDKLYTMFATDYELNSLAKKIYATQNIYSHKIALKKCGEAC